AEKAHHDLGALKFPQLKLGIFAIFAYVGAEVSIGSFLINFLGQENIMNIPASVSKNYSAFSWGGAMIGRVLGPISFHAALAVARKGLYMVGIAVAVFFLIFAIVDLSLTQISTFILFIAINLAAFFVGKSAPARTLSIFAVVNILLL